MKVVEIVIELIVSWNSNYEVWFVFGFSFLRQHTTGKHRCECGWCGRGVGNLENWKMSQGAFVDDSFAWMSSKTVIKVISTASTKKAQDAVIRCAASEIASSDKYEPDSDFNLKTKPSSLLSRLRLKEIKACQRILTRHTTRSIGPHVAVPRVTSLHIIARVKLLRATWYKTKGWYCTFTRPFL